MLPHNDSRSTRPLKRADMQMSSVTNHHSGVISKRGLPGHERSIRQKALKRIAQRKRGFKIFQEEVKNLQTSHWDWDYLSRADIEQRLQASYEQKRRRRMVAIVRLRRTLAGTGLLVLAIFLASIDLNFFTK